jgi:uncharacterized protein involved in tolerance to divalent cations
MSVESVIVVLSTFPSAEVAWEGAIHDDAETLAIIKTTADRAAAMRAEAIEVPIAGGHAPYLAWVIGEVS